MLARLMDSGLEGSASRVLCKRDLHGKAAVRGLGGQMVHRSCVRWKSRIHGEEHYRLQAKYVMLVAKRGIRRAVSEWPDS